MWKQRFTKRALRATSRTSNGTDENALARPMRSGGRLNTLGVREVDRVIAVRIKYALGDWCRRREISKEARQRKHAQPPDGRTFLDYPPRDLLPAHGLQTPRAPARDERAQNPWASLLDKPIICSMSFLSRQQDPLFYAKLNFFDILIARPAVRPPTAMGRVTDSSEART
jgi:hypothetical protein